MFPRFPFFYWSTLDNTEIRLGPNLYERRGKHNYWNRILFSFVWLFGNFFCLIRSNLLDKFFVPWTNFLFFGQILCSLDKFFVPLDNFFVLLDNFFVLLDNFFVPEQRICPREQRNCPYKTTTKNKNLCPFDEGRKSQNKWENEITFEMNVRLVHSDYGFVKETIGFFYMFG